MIPLQPPAVLLQGAPGAGKTDSLTTLVAAGIETFVLGTEPGFQESLIDAMTRRKLPMDKLHWATVQPGHMGWDAMKDVITAIGAQGFMELQNIKSGVGKTETRKPAMKFLEQLKDFQCERTGKSYGDTSLWDHSRALVVDSLSGLSIMAMALTIGYKPAAHQGEWGVAMSFLENLILKMTSDRKCFFVMTAHVEKESNEISGVQQIMASTLGRKLAPKIPRFFSEVVYAKRTITNGAAAFTWSTVDAQADLKNRALPISNNLIPDFKPIVDAYNARLKTAGGSATPPAGVSSKVA
jgi:hypothetical protein